jgi:GTP-binding protein
VITDVPEQYVGVVMEKMGARHADLLQMGLHGGRMRIEFTIPSRCLFGYRSEFLTDTRGEGIMSAVFDSYKPSKGARIPRYTGSLVAYEDGDSTAYGCFNSQDRGSLFIGAATRVYQGMIVGESPKQGDMTVNVCKKKQLTAIRSAGADEALRLVPPIKMSLEEAIEFIADDELIEVTPKSIRLRKTILDNALRMKAQSKLKNS